MNNKQLKEEVMKIVKLREAGKTNQEIANTLKWKLRKVAYWVARLKEEGYKLPKVHKGGRKPVDLSPH